MAQSDAQQAGDERRRTALRHGSRSPRLSCKGSQVRTKGNASRHMPTYDSCLVTLTGLVLRVLPRLALRVRTRATYACLASTCWLSITLGALLSADTAGSHFYGGNTADGRRESALCFTAVSLAEAQCVCVSHSAGLAGTSAGSSVQQRTPGGMWPLLCCQICHVCCVPSLGLARCARLSHVGAGAPLGLAWSGSRPEAPH